LPKVCHPLGARSTASWTPDLAGALMSINAGKGVEIGEGFARRALREPIDEMAHA